MSGIRTVNLVWEKRYRGAYPVSRYALSDEGTLTLAVPRPLAARTFDLTWIRADGGSEIRGGFAVETLLKLEISEATGTAIGMTSDDVYLFRGAAKDRFMSERQVYFVDAAMSADGARLVAAFSDLAGSTFAIAFGETAGKVTWMREFPGVLTSVAMAAGGNRLAAGSESGVVWLMDVARRDVWEFNQDEPVRAIACSQDGRWTAIGTGAGTVALIDGEGTRLWNVHLEQEILALALSADAKVCSALTAGRGGSPARIVCMGEGGQVGWDYDLERKASTIALSSSGQYIAVGGRDGTATLFEVVPATSSSGHPPSDLDALVESCVRCGDLASAVRLLRNALAMRPGDAALYSQFREQRDAWRSLVRTAAEERAIANDFVRAVAQLEALLHDDPLDIDTVRTLLDLRKQWAETSLAQAQKLDPLAQYQERETALKDAISADPDLLTARAALEDLYRVRADDFDAEGARLAAGGKPDEALAAYERAQAISPTEARARICARLHVDHEFASGMELYNAKRYREAAFQFKKVLGAVPDHAEARRYYAYAQRLLQDQAGDNLSDRFSKLE
jgi:tetratricopeptide (TPR) repeat protein